MIIIQLKSKISYFKSLLLGYNSWDF